MTRTTAIIDTNVVVAGFPTAQPDSPALRVLHGMMRDEFAFALSETLLAEYRDVLARPVPRRLHGMSDADIENMLAGFTRRAIMLHAVTAAPIAAPDPGDQFLWDLLAAHADVVLVTQDKLLLDDAVMRGRVMLPEAFLRDVGT
jgi:predicted nucleic acid-binding protein